MVFLIPSMAATINLNTSLTNIPYLEVCLLLACQDFTLCELYGVVFVRNYVTCIILILGTL